MKTTYQRPAIRVKRLEMQNELLQSSDTPSKTNFLEIGSENAAQDSYGDAKSNKLINWDDEE